MTRINCVAKKSVVKILHMLCMYASLEVVKVKGYLENQEKISPTNQATYISDLGLNCYSQSNFFLPLNIRNLYLAIYFRWCKLSRKTIISDNLSVINKMEKATIVASREKCYSKTIFSWMQSRN